jgi:hypothetical protein
MNIWRIPIILAETYTQGIYEWPDKISEILADYNLWM